MLQGKEKAMKEFKPAPDALKKLLDEIHRLELVVEELTTLLKNEKNR